ncbi:MAG TPA: hypothetical protein IAA52_07675 [Candidatus Pullichristensenella stercorigallinarum]|uniref:Carbohydrate-binding domain-containing protein n=1 Tax=Candidatus Pullichristensenella stercorigallinarum TaxID=2840909 RepID=A0A9D0ZMK0_9FIRM|nr:hypothetical protein [Candidatus Pullichristensenella stercorigallinarum]
MKRISKLLVLVLALSMAFTAAFAEGEAPTATAYKASAPITVDGDLSEWTLDSPIVIDQESQVIRDLSFWQGASDLSCTVYVMYDETNLYLAVDVTEDTPFGAIEMLPLDGEDNFKIYISTDPAADPARTEYGTNDFLLYLIVDNNYWDTAFDRSMIEKDSLERFTSKGMDGGEDVLEGYERAAATTSTGFIFEAVIPWANFSNDRIPVYTPASGDTIKFDFAITDISYPCPGTEYIPQMAWTGDLSINTNPSLWGNLTFE